MNIQEMQNLANQFLYKLGATTVIIYVKPTRKTIAAAVGIKINEAILGFTPPATGGFIYVNDKLLNKGFTDSEISFILAHECTHIFHNHVITTAFWNVLEQAVKGESNEHYVLVEFLKLTLAMSSKSKLPPNAETLRNQEYEADRIGVNITGDLASAISCLSKLAGNDMNTPSHTWELFGKAVPAMRMGERIATLRAGTQVA